MSETTEPDGKPAPEPEPTPTPGTGPAGAPESTPPETDEPAPAKEADEERDKEDRRTAGLRARLGAEQREREKAAREAAFWRQQAQQYAPQQETPEQAAMRLEAEADVRAEARLLARRFHEEGHAQYRDWAQKTKDLMDMGADGGMGQLLIEMPGGVRVAAALADDPAELQRITSIPTERGRAIALGRFAATLDTSDSATRAPRDVPQMTRAPAPIRPVTGRASPQFNEYTAPPEQLVDYYLKKDLERARGGSRR
jgi:hypothetical protein